jgi:threonine synthase
MRAGGGLWRYSVLLPISRADAVTLGEGGTPLLSLERTAKTLGVARLFAKDETRNPTWSFKDRLASVAISAAKSMGARVIVSSSTGNAGAAAAAYAAKAGMPCVIFTTGGAAGPLMIQMRAYGATVLPLDNKADRWPLMQQAVREFGWFPTSPFFGPVVGSNPYGIEGYKTVAFEIAEAMDWDVPDACVVPVCYGDALVGMWRGFEEMRALGWTRRTPRLIAAEIYGSLGQALREGTDALPDMPMTHDTVAKSTTATRSTYQALKAIRETGGTAEVVSNEAIMQWQQRLARDEGLYVEPASAGALAATQQLRARGDIKPGETVVALLTASGLKDTAATATVQGELPPVPKDRGEVLAMLKALNESAMRTTV